MFTSLKSRALLAVALVGAAAALASAQTTTFELVEPPVELEALVDSIFSGIKQLLFVGIPAAIGVAIVYKLWKWIF